MLVLENSKIQEFLKFAEYEEILIQTDSSALMRVISTTTTDHFSTKEKKKNEDMKHVLFYTKFFGNPYPMAGWNTNVKNCEYSNCKFTNERDDLPNLKDYAALIFHIRDMEVHFILKEI